MIPKPKTYRSRKNIEAARRNYCEHCQRVNTTFHVHHIRSRGARGSDVEDNLINLCFECHAKVHNGQIGRLVLEMIVCQRQQQFVLSASDSLS